MKCKACHHLNNPSDAECLMCGTLLYRGTPPVPAILYVFLAMCVFLPVFAVSGGTNKVVELFGGPAVWPKSGDQGFIVKVGPLPVGAGRVKNNGPLLIPVALGVFGAGAVLYLTRTPFATGTKVALSIAVVALVWGLYIVAVVRLAKELAAPRHAMGPQAALVTQPA